MRTGDTEKRSTDDRCSGGTSEWSWWWVFGRWWAVEHHLTDRLERESRLERRFVMFRMINCEKTKHERVAMCVSVAVVFDGKGIGGWGMTDSTTQVRESGGRFDPPLRWNAHPSFTVNDE